MHPVIQHQIRPDHLPAHLVRLELGFVGLGFEQPSAFVCQPFSGSLLPSRSFLAQPPYISDARRIYVDANADPKIFA